MVNRQVQLMIGGQLAALLFSLVLIWCHRLQESKPQFPGQALRQNMRQ
jgi:hypothetical protein